jgi:molybdate transport system substrate-binding protein
MNTLNILSGGAAQGLVGSLADKFKALTGFSIAGDFGAVGAMAGKLRAGAPADILILTAALIADLVREGRVNGASVTDVGRVETAVAVRDGDATVSVHDAASLRQALLEADAIFVPDTKASTAGIHVAKVLAQLGIAEDVAGRLQIYPNGATAMRHLAESTARKPIGATQATEILATRGVKLSGALPKGFDLATTYTAAVTARATHGREAQILIDLLTSKDTAPLRAQVGFLDPAPLPHPSG